MKYNYYNPVSRKYGYIEKLSGDLSPFWAFYVENGIKKGCCERTFDGADAIMKFHGYERMGIIDESGCRRYTLTLPQLQELYKKFEEFVADCTQQEFNENKAAITAVYTLIHKHLNAETMK